MPASWVKTGLSRKSFERVFFFFLLPGNACEAFSKGGLCLPCRAHVTRRLWGQREPPQERSICYSQFSDGETEARRAETQGQEATEPTTLAWSQCHCILAACPWVRRHCASVQRGQGQSLPRRVTVGGQNAVTETQLSEHAGPSPALKECSSSGRCYFHPHRISFARHCQMAPVLFLELHFYPVPPPLKILLWLPRAQTFFFSAVSPTHGVAMLSSLFIQQLLMEDRPTVRRSCSRTSGGGCNRSPAATLPRPPW